MTLPSSHFENTNSSREAVLREFAKVTPKIGELARRTVEMDLPEEADGLAVFLGLGEDARLECAVDLWRTDRFTHLLIGGVNPNEDDAPDEAEIHRRIEELGGERLGNVRVLPEARHTKDQADWLAHTLADLSVSRVVLIEPDYHLPRAYATTVASMYDQHTAVPMWGHGIDYPADFVTPDKRYDELQTPDLMAHYDANRIVTYQPKGDVASDELWDQHLRATTA